LNAASGTKNASVHGGVPHQNVSGSFHPAATSVCNICAEEYGLPPLRSTRAPLQYATKSVTGATVCMRATCQRSRKASPAHKPDRRVVRLRIAIMFEYT